MVGQMISLNQLEQLISINQNLTPTATAGMTGATGANPALATAASGLSSVLSPSVSAAATSQLPFDPNTMMPLGFGNAGAVSSTINSSLNAVNMGLSSTNNNMNNNTNNSASGGK
jgi:flagellar basal-body rod modification protein FlgD